MPPSLARHNRARAVRHPRPSRGSRRRRASDPARRRSACTVGDASSARQRGSLRRIVCSTVSGLTGRRPREPLRCRYASRICGRRSGTAGRLVVTGPSGYLLEVGRGELDVHRFEELVERADSAEPVDAAALWCGRRSGCGAGPRSRTSPTRTSHSRRSHGWTSCGSRRSNAGSKPISSSVVMRTSPASSMRSSGRIRCASACGASTCSPSIARAGRRMRSGRTRRQEQRSSTSSESSPGRCCISLSGRSCSRIRRSSWPGRPGPERASPGRRARGGPSSSHCLLLPSRSPGSRPAR